MKKIVFGIVITILLVSNTVAWVLFLNSHLEFLPQKITVAVNDFCYKLFNKEDNLGTADTSDYVLLSTLSNSPLLDELDLSVPNDTYIPSKEEISKSYSGLYSDSIFAVFTNYDIIIQNYSIAITDNLELTDFRKQIVSNLERSRRDIVFDTSFSITKENLEIPIIEFSTTHENRVTYSFIALVDVNGKLVTISVNSADYYLDASQFFYSLIANMVIK